MSLRTVIDPLSLSLLLPIFIGTCTDVHDQAEALASSRRTQEQMQRLLDHAAVTLWAIDLDAKITIAEGPGVRQLKLLSGPATPSGSEHDPNSSNSGGHSNSGGGGGGHSNHGSRRSNSGVGHYVGGSGRSETKSDHRSESSRSNSHRSGPNVAQKLAAQQKSMIGKSVYDIWDSPATRQAIQEAMKGKPVTQEMELEGRWFRTQYTPLRGDIDAPNLNLEAANDDGEILGVVGASMDITERKRAEQQLQITLHEKSRALASETAAKEASAMKSEFLANMVSIWSCSAFLL